MATTATATAPTITSSSSSTRDERRLRRRRTTTTTRVAAAAATNDRSFSPFLATTSAAATTTALPLWCWWFCFLVLMYGSSSRCSASSSAGGVVAPTPRYFSSSSSSLWKSWLNARCGPNGTAIWLYRGGLYDPLSGAEICGVEGVEIVRRLASLEVSVDDDYVVLEPFEERRKRYARRCNDLNVVDTLTSGPKSDVYAATVLSRKLFCYTKPSSSGRRHSGRRRWTRKAEREGTDEHDDDDGLRSLLRKFRLRPNSPERKISVEQAATVYDSATTVVETRSRNRRWRGGNGGGGGGGDLYLHTEWPDGRAIWTKPTLSLRDSGDIRGGAGDTASGGGRNKGDLEFAAYARPQPPWRQKLPNLFSANANGDDDNEDPSSSSAVVSPPRSALIQFANPLGGGGGSVEGQFGARETYHYTFEGDGDGEGGGDCTVRYTRYGEGPAWYGPGRMCALELTGRRVDDWQGDDLPRRSRGNTAFEVASRLVPGFFAANAAVPEHDDDLAARAVDSFRGRGRAPLRISPELAMGGGGGSRRFRVPDWVQSTRHSAGALLHRIQVATSLSTTAATASRRNE